MGKKKKKQNCFRGKKGVERAVQEFKSNKANVNFEHKNDGYREWKGDEQNITITDNAKHPNLAFSGLLISITYIANPLRKEYSNVQFFRVKKQLRSYWFDDLLVDTEFKYDTTIKTFTYASHRTGDEARKEVIKTVFKDQVTLSDPVENQYIVEDKCKNKCTFKYRVRDKGTLKEDSKPTAHISLHFLVSPFRVDDPNTFLKVHRDSSFEIGELLTSKRYRYDPDKKCFIQLGRIQEAQGNTYNKMDLTLPKCFGRLVNIQKEIELLPQEDTQNDNLGNNQFQRLLTFFTYYAHYKLNDQQAKFLRDHIEALRYKREEKADETEKLPLINGINELDNNSTKLRDFFNIRKFNLKFYKIVKVSIVHQAAFFSDQEYKKSNRSTSNTTSDTQNHPDNESASETIPDKNYPDVDMIMFKSKKGTTYLINYFNFPDFFIRLESPIWWQNERLGIDEKSCSKEQKNSDNIRSLIQTAGGDIFSDPKSTILQLCAIIERLFRSFFLINSKSVVDLMKLIGKAKAIGIVKDKDNVFTNKIRKARNAAAHGKKQELKEREITHLAIYTWKKTCELSYKLSPLPGRVEKVDTDRYILRIFLEKDNNFSEPESSHHGAAKKDNNFSESKSGHDHYLFLEKGNSPSEPGPKPSYSDAAKKGNSSPKPEPGPKPSYSGAAKKDNNFSEPKLRHGYHDVQYHEEELSFLSLYCASCFTKLAQEGDILKIENTKVTIKRTKDKNNNTRLSESGGDFYYKFSGRMMRYPCNAFGVFCKGCDQYIGVSIDRQDDPVLRLKLLHQMGVKTFVVHSNDNEISNYYNPGQGENDDDKAQYKIFFELLEQSLRKHFPIASKEIKIDESLRKFGALNPLYPKFCDEMFEKLTLEIRESNEEDGKYIQGIESLVERRKLENAFFAEQLAGENTKRLLGTRDDIINEFQLGKNYNESFYQHSDPIYVADYYYKEEKNSPVVAKYLPVAAIFLISNSTQGKQPIKKRVRIYAILKDFFGEIIYVQNELDKKLDQIASVEQQQRQGDQNEPDSSDASNLSTSDTENQRKNEDKLPRDEEEEVEPLEPQAESNLTSTSTSEGVSSSSQTNMLEQQHGENKSNNKKGKKKNSKKKKRSKKKKKQ